MPADSVDRYTISRSDFINQQVLMWAKVAREKGILGVFADIINWIEEQLATRPAEWGDPLFEFHYMGLPLYRGIKEFVSAEYGVREAEKIVFVKRYQLLPRNPLE